MNKIAVTEKLELVKGYWQPAIIAQLNGQHVKVAKLHGTFVWHKHDDADELFYVLKGRFVVELRDRTIELGEGDMIVIPKGIEHRPLADAEVSVLLFEPAGTLNRAC